MTEHLRGRVHTALSYICVTLIPKRVNRVLLLLINVFGTFRNQQFSDDNVSTKVVLPHRTRVSTLKKVGLVTAEASDSTNVSDREVNKHVGPDELRAPQASTSVPHKPWCRSDGEKRRSWTILPPVNASRSCRHSTDAHSNADRQQSLFLGDSMAACSVLQRFSTF